LIGKELGPHVPQLARWRCHPRDRWLSEVAMADRRRGYLLLADAQIWLMTLYDKGEVADLSAAEKRVVEGGPRRGTGKARHTASEKEMNYGTQEASHRPKEAQPLP